MNKLFRCNLHFLLHISSLILGNSSRLELEVSHFTKRGSLSVSSVWERGDGEKGWKITKCNNNNTTLTVTKCETFYLFLQRFQSHIFPTIKYNISGGKLVTWRFMRQTDIKSVRHSRSVTLWKWMDRGWWSPLRWMEKVANTNLYFVSDTFVNSIPMSTSLLEPSPDREKSNKSFFPSMKLLLSLTGYPFFFSPADHQTTAKQ